MATNLAKDNVWVDKKRFDQAECQYYESLTKELIKSKANKEREAESNGSSDVDELTPAVESAKVQEPKVEVELTAIIKPKKGNSGKKNNTNPTPEVNPAKVTEPEADAGELTNVVKPKKGNSGKKNTSTNPTPAVNSAKVQESEAEVSGVSGANNNDNPNASVNWINFQQPEKPVKPKKNKKKNKAQKNANASNAEGGNKPPANNQNMNKPFEEQQSKNKRNSGPQAQNRGTSSNKHSTLVSEIAKAREHIKNSLEKMDGIATLNVGPDSPEVNLRLTLVEKQNADLRKLVENLKNLVLDSQNRIKALESQLQKPGAAAKVEAAPKKTEAEDDDGVDLFASDSDEESEEAARIREERLAAYAAKKSKKPALIAKSSLVLDVKPWDDETDLNVMETEIRKITADGLLWGASKFVPVAFGIKKLSISCVVEDDKVSIDWLTEEIEKLEDYVQSVDVAAFNKI